MAGHNISITSYSTVANSSVVPYCKHWEPDSEVEIIAKRTAYVLLAVVGISFNMFVIALAMKFTVRKNLHHLIINMAVSDALFVFSISLQSLPWLSGYKWSIFPINTLGRITCKTATLLNETTFRVSLITLLVISIERFRATRRTMQRSRPYTLKQRVAVLGICWVIPMAFAVVCVYRAEPLGAGCMEPGGNRDLVYAFFITSLISFVFAVIVSFIILLLSIVTIRRLSQPQAIQAHLNEQQRQARTSRSKAAVRMVLASVLLYVLCWLPNFALVFSFYLHFAIPTIDIVDFSACIDWRSLFFIVADFLPLVNSCFSPCIYIIFLADFREAAKKVLCRRETLNQPPNRRRSLELQPMANPVTGSNRRRRRRRNSVEDDEEL